MNPRPTDGKSNALSVALPRHLPNQLATTRQQRYTTGKHEDVIRSPVFFWLRCRVSDPVYTIQPVVQPVVKQPVVQPVVKQVEQRVEQLAASCKQTFNRLSNLLFNRFDNRLYRVNRLSVYSLSFPERRSTFSLCNSVQD